ncbi:SRPBCC family protein [Algibacter sp. AS12]|uniref:SRPBCC family protein n=1 Tax=Algibacter sp. AS12 TaxID=3135773 RepID=UPI00398A7374
MTLIKVETQINADIKTCFDLARDLDFYQQSLKHSKEIAISGKTTGLVDLDDIVIWETSHLGYVQHLTLKIVDFQSPKIFVDEIVNGSFKAYRHEHIFEEENDKTIMIDLFYYELPYGVFGKFLDWIYVKGYMSKLLKTRNQILRAKAEQVIVA